MDFRVLPWIGLSRLAHVAYLGAIKHGPDAWRRESASRDRINKALSHLAAWLRRERDEDHLAHAAWNLLAEMELESADGTDWRTHLRPVR